MIIPFNGYELKKISSMPEAHIILIFCLYLNKMTIDKQLAHSTKLLKTKLHITKIPNILSELKLVIFNERTGIFSNYVCREPQGYITNFSFLHSKVPPIEKSEYIELLSYRAINNTNNWIPIEYATKQQQSNPFITLTKDKLIFKLEKQI